ncbi:MAG TPA: hypothetical protein PLL25_12090, partial [Flavobacteriales bacterium]|nr:hypothetical protein [Flavobacteriales bacterium]
MKRAGLALAGSLACSGLSAQVDSFWSVPSPGRSEVNADRQFVPEQALEIDLSSDRLDLLFGRNVQGVHEVT